jgi:hypothetical protein
VIRRSGLGVEGLIETIRNVATEEVAADAALAFLPEVAR